MMGDMTQTYGATSHCEVTTCAAARREQRFRPMRQARELDAFRSCCIKSVNLDDHGSGVAYESGVPTIPQPGTIAEDKLRAIRKALATFEPPEVGCSFARGGNVSVVCCSKIDTDRNAPWEGLHPTQAPFLKPKTMEDKGGRRKSTSDDGGNLNSDARLVLNFYVRARALARWASARRKLRAWRALMGGFGGLGSGSGGGGRPSARAPRTAPRVSSTAIAESARSNAEAGAVLAWPPHKFIEKEIVKFFKKLTGVYGIVLVDVERRHMFAARDPEGTVPLHMALTADNCVLVATEEGLLPAKATKTRAIAAGKYVYGPGEYIMEEAHELDLE